MYEITKRIERLERQNRRMKLVGGAGLMIAAVVLIMGQGFSERTLKANKVETRQLMIVDKKGAVRGFMGVIDGNPALVLGAAEGSVISLTASKKPTLQMVKKGEKISISLGVGRDGSPGLDLYGEGGDPQATLTVLRKGSALFLGDHTTPGSVSLVNVAGKGKGEKGLYIFGSGKSAARIALVLKKNNASGLILRDNNQRERITMGVVPTKGAAISLLDGAGNSTWVKFAR